MAIIARKKCIAKKITDEKPKETDETKTSPKMLKKVGKLVGKEIINEVLETDAGIEPNLELEE